VIAASVFEQTLNRLLRAAPGASDALQRHAGQSVRFDLVLGEIDLRIADDGYFSEYPASQPDATIRPTAALFTRLPFFGRDALRAADYQGDPALLATLDRVFKTLAPDLAAELAPLVGDAAAQRSAQWVAERYANVQHAGAALGVNAAEYLVEEAELLARPVDVARFGREVDTLADAVARVEARIKRLESRAAPTETADPC
jgi:ubiquinone biosynthesis protein UbiJ